MEIALSQQLLRLPHPIQKAIGLKLKQKRFLDLPSNLILRQTKKFVGQFAQAAAS
jgi:hypothetical protein